MGEGCQDVLGLSFSTDIFAVHLLIFPTNGGGRREAPAVQDGPGATGRKKTGRPLGKLI
jgi:hypothetical protein